MENNIRKLAKEKGIAIAEIIRISGLSKSFFYEILNGEARPNLENAYKIANALNATVTEVFPQK